MLIAASLSLRAWMHKVRGDRRKFVMPWLRKYGNAHSAWDWHKSGRGRDWGRRSREKQGDRSRLYRRTDVYSISGLIHAT